MSSASCTIELTCPAKINLSLAILGRRPDGFHDLHSVVSQTGFGDQLSLQWDPDCSPGSDQVVFTGDTGWPNGEKLELQDNTVIHAIREFREASGFRGGSIQVEVEKSIPAGAGLGGGSSDAVTTLKAIREVAGDRCPNVDWEGISASIGSDCPLFFADEPVIMEGRGERISPLEESLAQRLRGRPVILFKPRFSINTAEAYRRLASRESYREASLLLQFLKEWKSSGNALPPNGNDFERLYSWWIPSLAIVLGRLNSVHGMTARLSGSGSACFLLTDNPDSDKQILEDELIRAWGEGFWLEVSYLK